MRRALAASICYAHWIVLPIAGVSGPAAESVAVEPQQPESVAASLDRELDAITKMIVGSLSEKLRSSVAVSDIMDLEGAPTNFGRLLSDELVSRLVETGQFFVVDRLGVARALEGAGLEVPDLAVPGSATRIGSILEVDTIIVGTIATIAGERRVNIRLLAAETGAAFAAARGTFPGDQQVHSGGGEASEPGEQLSAVPEYGPGEIFFEEDFASNAGPESWGKQLTVIGASDGRRYLTSMVPGKHLAGRDVAFPRNFEFEYDWSFYDDRRSGRTAPYVRVPLDLTDENGRVFRLECGNWGARLPGFPVVDFSERRGINRFRLTREGDTYSIHNNGRLIQSGHILGYGRFVSFRITIPVRRDGKGQQFGYFRGVAK